MTVDSARLTLATWLKPLRARSLVMAVLVAVVAGAVGSRIDDSPPDAKAAGGPRLFVVGVAADSAPVQPTPHAWVSFFTEYDIGVAGYRYTLYARSHAPVWTTERLPAATGWGDGPSVIGPFEFTQVCSLVNNTAVSKIPLRTHGLLLPASQLPSEIILALEPATYRSATTFDCPSAGKGVVTFDTSHLWVLFHLPDFADYAGAYLFANFTVPDADDPGCVVARLRSDKTKSQVREQLDIVITDRAWGSPNCSPGRGALD